MGDGGTAFDNSYVIRPVSVASYADGVEAGLMAGVWATRAKPPPPGTDPRLIPPINVRAVRMRPDYEVRHGRRDAMAKEVRRVEGFEAWHLVRIRPHVQGWP
jgi:hypothetical protein